MDLSTITVYLLMPLRAAPLLLIVIFSCGLAFASVGGIIGIPLAVICSSWFLKYTFVLLDHVAQGKLEPPVLAVEMINPLDEQRPFMFLLLLIGLFYATDAASYWLGPVLGLLTGIVALAIVPAIVAVQGATGSVLQSLHPGIVFGLIARLRGDYLLILVCALLFAGLDRAIVVSPLVASYPLVVRIAMLMYLWMALFALIGGVLFTRRLDIGLEAAYAPEQAEARENRERDHDRKRIMDTIYGEWRGGAKGNAWQTVTKLLESSKEPLADLRWLHEYASHWPDPGLANRLARELLPELLEAKLLSEALRVLQARIRADSSFRPANSADLLTLTRLARDAGDRPTARALLNDFERFYPQDKEQHTVDILSQQLQR